MHCKCALCGTFDQACVCSTASAESPSVAGLSACPATCGRRHKSHKLFCGACLATARRAAAEHEDLGRTSTLELACDAGTLGSLSAGDLARFFVLSHLPSPCSSAASQRDLQKVTFLLPTFCSLTFDLRVFGSKVDGPMALRELHRTMHLWHAADGRPRREVGKTAGLRLIVWNPQTLLS